MKNPNLLFLKVCLWLQKTEMLEGVVSERNLTTDQFLSFMDLLLLFFIFRQLLHETNTNFYQFSENVPFAYLLFSGRDQKVIQNVLTIQIRPGLKGHLKHFN